MAVIYEKENDNSAEPFVKDSVGFFRALSWPVGLSLRERVKLYRRGKKDGHDKKAIRNEYDELSSVYCEPLVQSANEKIELEWQKCNEACFEARAQVGRIDALQKRIKELRKTILIERDKALDDLNNIQYDGDKVVSEHLAKRRQQQRENRIISFYDTKITALNEQLDNLEIESIPYNNTFEQTEEIAISNEQVIKANYLWRLSVYAYGASNYIKITPDMINANFISDEPRKRHFKMFKRTDPVFKNSQSSNSAETQNSELPQDDPNTNNDDEDNQSNNNDR